MILRTFSAAAAAAVLCSSSVYALQTEKRDIKNNMIINYKKLPGSTDSFGGLFSEGMLYGRLRFNAHLLQYDNTHPDPSNNASIDPYTVSVGGSLIYKTAYLEGFGATAALYYAEGLGENYINEKPDGTNLNGRMGLDYIATHGEAIAVLAEGYVEYKNAYVTAKAGRQIFESTLIRSNDTKMVPNTFEGVTLVSKALPGTLVRGAYFTRQKLRNHNTFDSVLAVNDIEGTEFGNNDAGRHKGLTYSNIKAAGEEAMPHMILLTAENRSVTRLKLNLDYMMIPGYVSSLIPEANYKIALGQSGWSLMPGVRYYHQMDEGAGAIGGAALSGKLAGWNRGDDAMGYDDPDSVDSGMWAARLKLAKAALSLEAGYTHVLDRADLIAPWRGFPTGGYSRSMAMYNWEANTRSWMLKAYYDFGKANVVEGLRGSLDYADMDYDDAKLEAGSLSKTDRNIVHLDVWKTFKAVPGLELKFRTAFLDAQRNPYAADTTDYTSYAEYRFEANYLF